MEEKQDDRHLLPSTGINGIPNIPRYRVSDAIGNVLKDDGQGTPGWTCEICVKDTSKGKDIPKSVPIAKQIDRVLSHSATV